MTKLNTMGNIEETWHLPFWPFLSVFFLYFPLFVLFRYRCPICSLDCNWIDNARRHMRRLHNITPQILPRAKGKTRLYLPPSLRVRSSPVSLLPSVHPSFFPSFLLSLLPSFPPSFFPSFLLSIFLSVHPCIPSLCHAFLLPVSHSCRCIMHDVI